MGYVKGQTFWNLIIYQALTTEYSIFTIKEIAIHFSSIYVSKLLKNDKMLYSI